MDQTEPNPESHTLSTPKGSRKTSLSLVDSGGTHNPPPRRFSLATVRGCRSELASLYRMARAGQMDLSEACKFGYLVTSIAKLIEIGDLERRLNELEHLGDQL